MFFRKKKSKEMSFRQSFALSGLPIISFKSNREWINLVFDTGCNYSVVDRNALKKFDYILLDTKSEIVGIEGKINKGEAARLLLSYENEEYSIECGVVDMGEAIKELKSTYGVVIHGILGTDFFDKYKYTIDFNKMIAFSQKI